MSLAYSYSVGMALSELRLLYIAQNPDTTLPFVSLENDVCMMIYCTYRYDTQR